MLIKAIFIKMGMIQSQTEEIKYPEYSKFCDEIGTKSVNYIYNKIKTKKFTTPEEMIAVTVFLMEKGIVFRDISLNCAELAKKLESETVMVDGEEEYFHVVFADAILKKMEFLVSVHDDKYLSDKLIARAKNIAFFLGNLFNCDFLDITPILELCQLVKSKETPANSFFRKELFNTMKDKLKEENIDEEKFNWIIQVFDAKNIDRNTVFDKDDDDLLFDLHLQDITANAAKSFEHYEHFAICRDDIFKLHVDRLLKDSVKDENNFGTFKAVAHQIHSHSPKKLMANFQTTLFEFVERYQIDEIFRDKENWNKFSHLGRILAEFYNDELIPYNNLMKWFELARQKHAPTDAFILRFNEVKMKLYDDEYKVNWNHLKTILNVPAEAQFAMNELLKYHDIINGKIET